MASESAPEPNPPSVALAGVATACDKVVGAVRVLF